MKTNKIIKGLALTLVVGAIALTSVGCGSKKADSADKKTVKIGLVGSDTDVWDYVAKKLEKEDGIKLDLVKFTDYNQPNDALVNGDIDLNSFQHRIFLENYNKEKGSDLEPIADTVIAPLGIYSEKLQKPTGIKEGGSIVIPNDVTNQGRSLVLLQTAGLIKLDEKAGNLATVNDIKENPKKLKITPVDASQTARSLKDVDLSVINSGMAVDAGFIPNKDAKFLEPVNENSKPYINIIVARKADKDKEIFKKIVAAYQADDVKKVIEETSKGSSIPAWENK